MSEEQVSLEEHLHSNQFKPNAVIKQTVWSQPNIWTEINKEGLLTQKHNNQKTTNPCNICNQQFQSISYQPGPVDDLVQSQGNKYELKDIYRAQDFQLKKEKQSGCS